MAGSVSYTHLYRAMINKVQAPRYWDFGEDDKDFKWNNYISRYHTRHLDLMDLLAMFNGRANAPLDEIAQLCGFPGKLGMDGSKVWSAYQAGEIEAIRNYCETDEMCIRDSFLKEQSSNIQIIGVQPEEGAQIPGIRKWPEEYLPKIYDAKRVDELIYVGQKQAEDTTRKLAMMEGIFAGISSGGGLYAALQLSKRVENATIVSIVCAVSYTHLMASNTKPFSVHNARSRGKSGSSLKP